MTVSACCFFWLQQQRLRSKINKNMLSLFICGLVFDCFLPLGYFFYNGGNKLPLTEKSCFLYFSFSHHFANYRCICIEYPLVNTIRRYCLWKRWFPYTISWSFQLYNNPNTAPYFDTIFFSITLHKWKTVFHMQNSPLIINHVKRLQRYLTRVLPIYTD